MRLTGQVRHHPPALRSLDEDQTAVEGSRDPNPFHLAGALPLDPTAKPEGVKQQLAVIGWARSRTSAGEAHSGDQTGEGLRGMLHGDAFRTDGAPPPDG